MFNPFNTQNEYIIESKRDLLQFDIDQMTDNLNFLKDPRSTYKAINKFTVKSSLDFIGKSMNNLTDLSVDVSGLIDFYAKVYKSTYLSDKNIAVRIQIDDVLALKPEYLKAIYVEYNDAIKRLLNGEYKKLDIKMKYVDSGFFDKIKKNLVRTDNKITDIKKLLYISQPDTILIDNSFIQNNIIPFLQNHDISVKELENLVKNVRAIIEKTHNDIVDVFMSISKLWKEKKIDAKNMKVATYISYIFLRNYMEQVNYLSAMTIRKLSKYTYNLIEYTNLHDIILEYFPEGDKILHESSDIIDTSSLSAVDDTTLLQGMLTSNLAFMIPTVRSILGLKKSQLAQVISNKYKIKVQGELNLNTIMPYDVMKYIAVNNALLSINQSLLAIKNLFPSDLSSEEILNQTDITDLKFKYRDTIIANLTNIEYYTNTLFDENSRIEIAVYNDLNNFEKNLESITNNIALTDSMFTELFEYLQKPIDDEINSIVGEELYSIISQYYTVFKAFIIEIGRKLIIRLEKLNDIEIEDGLTSVKVESFNDYSEMHQEYIYEFMEEEYKKQLKPIVLEFHKLEMKEKYNIDIVYEEVADAPKDAKSSITLGKNNDANKSSENNTSTPEKSTDSNDSSKNIDDTDKTTDEKKRKDFENLIERLKEWFRRLFSKFKKNGRELVDASKFIIEDNKEFFENFNDTGGSVVVAKYVHVDTNKIKNIISTTSGKVNSINASTAKDTYKTEASLEKFLLPEIAIDGKDSLNSKALNYLLYGHPTNKDKQMQTFTGDDYVNRVKSMYKYCSNYINTMNDIENICKPLADAAAEKEAEIKEAVKKHSTSKNETTTDTSNFKIENSIVNTCSVLSYAAASAHEKKFTDYIQLLSSLVPKKK